ncbi:MAG: enoyl-CoA hydratase/isomerase family protein, partial [Deltaproteobacteria bacterium]|nr:enoyl-CoA hydratase/isomerase family protein [Deltaproteobacteria bacterium]
MAEIDFSAARDAASQLLVDDSTDPSADLASELIGHARRFLELTDSQAVRTPAQDADLLASLDFLRKDESVGRAQSSYQRAHEALDRLIQARGGATPSAVQLAGVASASAVPAAVAAQDGAEVVVSLVVDESTGIGRIKIERPSKRNALDPQIVADLLRRFDEAEKDSRVKMIVLEGVGGNLAGNDIEFLVQNLNQGAEGLDRIMRFVKSGLDLFSRIEQSPKRVVAVLDGGTFGGGLELALAANEIIVTPQAKLALSETALGNTPSFRGADRLALRIGEGFAFYFMATGNTGDRAISAQQAYEIGIADHLVERSDLDSRLAEMAGTAYKGSRPRNLPDGHPLKLIADMLSIDSFRQALIQGIDDPLYQDEKLSDHPDHYAQYRAALEIARQRPRAALAVADQLLTVDNNEENYRLV